MSESAVRYRTHSVELMTRVVAFEEEHSPIANGARPSALLARVLEQLAEAAFCQAVVEGDIAEEALDEDCEHSDLGVATYFLRLGLAAIAAAARVHPDVPDHPLPHSKALLLDKLDADAADWIDAREDWDGLGAAFFIRAVTSLLKGAAVAAGELDGLYEVISPDLDIEDPGDEDGEEQLEPAVRFGESLFQAAMVAVAAAEWFEERHLEDEVSGTVVRARPTR